MSTTASSERRPTAPAAAPDVRHRVLVVGGGTAGIAVAARLRRRRPDLDVALLEPSETHYYQPLWTLVAAGVGTKEATARPQESLVPEGVAWIRSAAAEFRPDERLVVTGDGRRIAYDALVVAVGIELDWGAVPGLAEALETPSVTSNWSYELVDRTWSLVRGFRGGTAVFTFPSTPIKCPGAAQKVAYLADDHFRRAGVRDRSRLVFASAGPRIFGVDKYARALERVVARKEIETLFRHDLVEVRPDSRLAVFRHLDTGEEAAVAYDLLHVAPPQRAPDVVRRSPLGGAAGWVDVDPATLRHVRYPDVFSLGDASSLPTSKTGAAVRAQAPVAAENLLAHLDGREPPARYDGYTACPLVTGYGRLILAEFDYECRPRETFPFDQSKERRSMYELKRRGLPLLYWHGILRGRA